SVNHSQTKIEVCSIHSTVTHQENPRVLNSTSMNRTNQDDRSRFNSLNREHSHATREPSIQSSLNRRNQADRSRFNSLNREQSHATREPHVPNSIKHEPPKPR